VSAVRRNRTFISDVGIVPENNFIVMKTGGVSHDRVCGTRGAIPSEL
jgi:hypothetical protein